MADTLHSVGSDMDFFSTAYFW